MKSKTEHLLTLLGILFMSTTIWACPVCENQQPKITQGLTHGAGPQSNWDWFIIAIITGITLFTFILSLKYLINPKEENAHHIKQSILNN